MVAMFALAILGAMYLTGGIGDGVGLFESDETASPGEDGTAAAEADGTDRPDDLFDDDDGSDAEEAIELAVRSGALSRCGRRADRTFCPQQPISRAEFAVALDAVLDLPDADNPFDDVPADAPYAGAVGRLAADGAIRGCAEQQFCPDDPVTRGQAAALVARIIDLPAEPVQSFEDVPAGSVFAEVIGRMAAQGVMRACVAAPPQFCPDGPLLRGDAAAMLARSGLIG